jgi:hypothetical protein
MLYFVRKITSDELDFNDKNAVIVQFLQEFNNEAIVKEKQQPKFSHILYDFLEKEIFGQDMADVAKIDSRGISELDIEKYNRIKNNCLVEISSKPITTKAEIIGFDAVHRDGGRFRLFWIDNESSQLRIHIGDDLYK